MKKHLKLIIGTAVGIVVVAVHFIPLYNQTGALSPETTASNIADRVCIGYMVPDNHSYRFILNGTHRFTSEKSRLSPGMDGCDPVVHLRFYLW